MVCSASDQIITRNQRDGKEKRRKHNNDTKGVRIRDPYVSEKYIITKQKLKVFEVLQYT